MRILSPILVFLTLVSTFTAPAIAQDFTEQFSILSRNNTFESGVGGWNNTQLTSSLRLHETPSADLGLSYVNLKGVGTWGQTLTVPVGSQRHVLNAYAFKRATQGTGSGGYACIAVSYYDAKWVELDKVTIPLDGQSPYNDGFNFVSWGIDVPKGAVNAFMFVYCSSGTEVNVDTFGLFDYKIVNDAFIAPTLIARPQMSSFFSSSGPDEVAGYGVEFWETDFDPSKSFDGLLGSPVQEESAYQFVSVKPGRVYSLYAFVDQFGPYVPAYYGIDFYDAAWKPIGHVEMEMTNGIIGRRLTVPPQTAHASVWVWCDQIPVGVDDFFLRPTMFLREQATTINSNTSVSCIGQTLLAPRVGAIEGGLRVAYSDAEGIDVSTIDVTDAYYVSKSNPSKSYPVNSVSTTKLDGGKLVIVKYFVKGLPFETYADFGSLVIRSGQVKDSKGLTFAGRVFRPISIHF